MRPAAGDRLGRRLAAILAADVVGYSRLMGEDEIGTLFRLKDTLKGVVTPAIARRNGRVVGTFGDGLLAEFGSVADAVACAIEIQRDVGAAQSSVPDSSKLNFRIGVNLGDVIHDGDDIFGDGVNIAARLQAVAQPAEICVSGAVRDAVRNKLQVGFVDRGEQQFKNIAQPVHVFAVTWDAAHWAFAPREGGDTGDDDAEAPAAFALPRPIVLGVIAVAAIILGAVGYGSWHARSAALTTTAVLPTAPPVPAKASAAPSASPTPVAKVTLAPAVAKPHPAGIARTVAKPAPNLTAAATAAKPASLPTAGGGVQDAGVPVVPAANAPPAVSEGTAPGSGASPVPATTP